MASTSIETAFERARPGISPKGLLEALEDASVIEKMCRGDLYVLLGDMRVLSKSPSFTMSHRLQYMNLLAKLGNVTKPDQLQMNASNLPQITINIPDYSQVRRTPRLDDIPHALRLAAPAPSQARAVANSAGFRSYGAVKALAEASEAEFATAGATEGGDS